MAETQDADGRHLRVLTELLSRDYMARAEWAEVLGDIARNVRSSVAAQEALVATWSPERDAWEAVISSGRTLHDADIARHGSRAVLDLVREKGTPVLTTGDLPMPLSSGSVARHRIRGVLAVPLHWWDVTAASPRRTFGGCIYAHRTAERQPFKQADVAIVSDITRLSEPLLNVLRCLKGVQARLTAVEEEASELRRATSGRYRFGRDQLRLPGAVFDTLARVVKNRKVTLLVTGPTGSGKTHLARAYHHACPRRDRPLVVLDCASVTAAETLGAELFGYAMDSGYANAPKKGRAGKAKLADGGSLFVDEVGCLALELQPKLLRLIEEGRFSPLGGSAEEAVDIQVIAATSRDLLRAIEEGTFRADLYHRLAVVRVDLPGLGHRSSEIPSLAQEILEHVCAEVPRDAMTLSPEALRALVKHDWNRDGNIRGLENLVRRSVWGAPVESVELAASDLCWLAEAGAPRGEVAKRRDGEIDSDEIKLLRSAIREHGTAAAAAQALGMTYRQVYWKLERAGLNVRRVLADRD